MATKNVTLTPLTLTNGVATKASQTSILVSSYFIVGDSNNTGNIYLGDSSVTTTNGRPIAKNQQIDWDFDPVGGNSNMTDLSKIFLDTDTTGNKARLGYTLWRTSDDVSG